MNALGVILARAGSVGLKDKHLLPLLGRPVIEYTFDHALTSRRLTHLVVSTDCPRIRQLAERYRIETIARPVELATSDASVQDVLIHAMDEMAERHGTRFDAVVTLYGNVAIRGPGVIDRAVAHLVDHGGDSVRTFCPVGKWHPGWMSRLHAGRVEPLRAGSIHRRQDLEPLFLHDGAVVVCTRSALERGRIQRDDPHAFFGLDRRGIETQAGETVEIDSKRDFYMAEAILRERHDFELRAAV
jgi:CMP-N-acetylneuraminic acid synthetase